MDVALRPGEYLVWRGENWRPVSETVAWIVIAIGLLTMIVIAGFFLIVIGVVFLVMARRSGKGEYVVTNMRAIALYKGVSGELELNTPNLTVGLVPRRINIVLESSPGVVTYDVVFTVNGVERLRFVELKHDSAHELVTKLNSMGVKITTSPVYLL
jgi:hypothetical protein